MMNDIEKAIYNLTGIYKAFKPHAGKPFKQYLGVAIQALQEKQEREKGCKRCFGIKAFNFDTETLISIKDNKIVLEDGKTDVELSYSIDYCPVCGRKLNIANKT